jgi:hypothetical protein
VLVVGNEPGGVAPCTRSSSMRRLAKKSAGTPCWRWEITRAAEC